MGHTKIRDSTIVSAEELCAYLTDTANKHHNFKHYTKATYTETIINTHTVYLSNGEKWNDRLDKQNLDKDQRFVNYVLSFSFSRSENVAMWLLYSGNNGCMIDYPPELIRSLLAANSVILGAFCNGVFVPAKVMNKDDFSISLFDIVYYAESKKQIDNLYYVKRSGESNPYFPQQIIDCLSYQKKRLAWSYENECRIVVSIEKSLLGGALYEMAAITFPEDYIPKLSTRIYNSPNLEHGKYNDSVLKTEMNWNLCKNCAASSK